VASSRRNVDRHASAGPGERRVAEVEPCTDAELASTLVKSGCPRGSPPGTMSWAPYLLDIGLVRGPNDSAARFAVKGYAVRPGNRAPGQKSALQHSLSCSGVIHKPMAPGPVILILWCHADHRTTDLGAVAEFGIFVTGISAAE
jgi:hypothetical protein